jgi:hypothetical protein
MGYVSQKRYDAFGRMVQEFDSFLSGIKDGLVWPSSTAYVYDLFDRTVEVTDGRNVLSNGDRITQGAYTEIRAYDQRNRLIQRTQAEQWHLLNDDSDEYVRRRFELGILSPSDPHVGASVAELKSAVNVNMIKGRTLIADLYVDKYSYDGSNNLIATSTLVDQANHAAQPTLGFIGLYVPTLASATQVRTEQTFDGMNRIIKTDVLNDNLFGNSLVWHEVTQVHYDVFGNVRQKIDADNRVTESTYGAFGRELTEVTSSPVDGEQGTSKKFVYDSFGRQTGIYVDTAAPNEFAHVKRAMTRTYDEAGRVLSETTWIDGDHPDWKDVDGNYLPDAQVIEATNVYTYTLDGLRATEVVDTDTKMGHAHHSTTNTYDFMGKLTMWTQTYTDAKFGAEWDGTGQGFDQSMLTKSANLVYAYDNDGRMLNIFTLDKWLPDGPEAQNFQFQNWKNDVNVYGSTGRLWNTHSLHTLDENTGQTYTYDAAGNKTSYINGNEEERYVYDASNHVTRVWQNTTDVSSNQPAKRTDMVYDTQGNVVFTQTDLVEADASGWVDGAQTKKNVDWTRSTYDLTNHLRSATGFSTDIHTDAKTTSNSHSVYDQSGRLRQSVSSDGDTVTIENHSYYADGRAFEIIAGGDYRGSSGWSYDLNGHLVSTSRFIKDVQSTAFLGSTDRAVDAEGTVLASYQFDIPDGHYSLMYDTGKPVALRDMSISTQRSYLYANGQLQAEQGYRDTEYAASAQKPDDIEAWFNINGTDQTGASVVGVVSGDGDDKRTVWTRNGADYSLTANAGAVGGGSFTYTLQAGESLQDIAGRLWGDSSSWYVIANDNSCSLRPPAGTVLHIRSAPNNAQPTSDRHLVFDDARVVGSNQPGKNHVVTPPNECVQLTVVAVVTVVSVAATALTAGAAAGLSALAIASASAGGVVLGAATTAAITVGVSVGVGFVSGLATGLIKEGLESASQGRAFNGLAVFESGLTGALDAGLGAASPFIPKWADFALKLGVGAVHSFHDGQFDPLSFVGSAVGSTLGFAGVDPRIANPIAGMVSSALHSAATGTKVDAFSMTMGAIKLASAVLDASSARPADESPEEAASGNHYSQSGSTLLSGIAQFTAAAAIGGPGQVIRQRLVQIGAETAGALLGGQLTPLVTDKTQEAADSFRPQAQPARSVSLDEINANQFENRLVNRGPSDPMEGKGGLSSRDAGHELAKIAQERGYTSSEASVGESEAGWMSDSAASAARAFSGPNDAGSAGSWLSAAAIADPGSSWSGDLSGIFLGPIQAAHDAQQRQRGQDIARLHLEGPFADMVRGGTAPGVAAAEQGRRIAAGDLGVPSVAARAEWSVSWMQLNGHAQGTTRAEYASSQEYYEALSQMPSIVPSAASYDARMARDKAVDDFKEGLVNRYSHLPWIAGQLEKHFINADGQYDRDAANRVEQLNKDYPGLVDDAEQSLAVGQRMTDTVNRMAVNANAAAGFTSWTASSTGVSSLVGAPIIVGIAKGLAPILRPLAKFAGRDSALFGLSQMQYFAGADDSYNGARVAYSGVETFSEAVTNVVMGKAGQIANLVAAPLNIYDVVTTAPEGDKLMAGVVSTVTESLNLVPFLGIGGKLGALVSHGSSLFGLVEGAYGTYGAYEEGDDVGVARGIGQMLGSIGGGMVHGYAAKKLFGETHIEMSDVKRSVVKDTINSPLASVDLYFASRGWNEMPSFSDGFASAKRAVGELASSAASTIHGWVGGGAGGIEWQTYSETTSV